MTNEGNAEETLKEEPTIYELGYLIVPTVVEDQIGAEVMPAKSCPLVKATFGMFQVEHEQLKKMKTVVVPTTCDQKKKAAEMLASSGVDITVLEIPPHRDSKCNTFFNNFFSSTYPL